MLKAILFDLGDTLFDFEPMNRAEVFETAGRKTYDFLASMGHTLPPFKRYYKSQVWTVRWAYPLRPAPPRIQCLRPAG